jgi:hypothetical protein
MAGFALVLTGLALTVGVCLALIARRPSIDAQVSHVLDWHDAHPDEDCAVCEVLR